MDLWENKQLDRLRVKVCGPGRGPVGGGDEGAPAQRLESNKVLSSRAGADVRLIFDLNWKLRAPERGPRRPIIYGNFKGFADHTRVSYLAARNSHNNKK